MGAHAEAPLAAPTEPVDHYGPLGVVFTGLIALAVIAGLAVLPFLSGHKPTGASPAAAARTEPFASFPKAKADAHGGKADAHGAAGASGH
jgi:hypothetical protein